MSDAVRRWVEARREWLAICRPDAEAEAVLRLVEAVAEYRAKHIDKTWSARRIDEALAALVGEKTGGG